MSNETGRDPVSCQPGRNLSASDYGGSDLMAARAALTARRADIENVIF